MKVGIAQVYTKAGVSFPFSHLMQRFMSQELSAVSGDCDPFRQKYGSEFSLGLWIGADTGIVDNKIVGPGVYKKTKDVEYSVFLPFDTIADASDGCRVAMEFLVSGVRAVFLRVGINPTKLDERTAFIIDHVCSDPTMLKGPWPYGPRSRGVLH